MNNTKVFEGKTFEELLKDIYDNTIQKKKSIQDLKDVLSGLINNAHDAALVVPLVKDLLEVEVKSDEHLVKMATIIQRLISGDTGKGSGLEDLLTEQEKQDLLNELDSALQADVEVMTIKKKAKHILEVKDAQKDS